ncbi:hypothetical protein GL325_00925 [Aeromicrobium sp. 636]|uniref:Uncharacterized protein n=1 Tax=Aeromicrobium senzhongii TaxID=2663859 RepID=A0A8I0JZM8_9ACTN|nr:MULTISPECIES: hypothetical protein [Aeromicrobium]MBC9224873.1 hypothetical protein [Aeromicrobium senzhongii]MCQ3996985.1 hypothetical protein [Aeromicrobium sp. 636]MTB86919.1 hypothetical protein [Aeromicrobium senzhongii]QNL93251.1 hypothetical protein H9L21_08880 [Aeromicrobium senzhongii]
MALEFVDEVPASTVGRGRGSRIYTPEVIEALKDHPGKWAKVPGATPGNAAAFKRSHDGFDYKSVNTGKTKKNAKGEAVAVYDVYLTFNP